MIVQHITNVETELLKKASAFSNMIAGSDVNGTSRVKRGGGIFLQLPMKLLKNQSQGAIPLRGATVNMSISQQFVYGVLNWKGSHLAVNFDLQDYAFNKYSEEAKEDLIKEKMLGAEEDYQQMIAQQFILGTTQDPLNPDGFLDMIAPSGTPYAGLLDTDYASQGDNPYLPYQGVATGNVNYQAISELIQKVLARTKDAKIGGKMFGMWPSALGIKFRQTQQAQQRFVNEDLLKSGFGGVQVDGCPMYYDENLTYQVTDSATPPVTTTINTVAVFPEEIMNLYAIYGFGRGGSPFDGEVRVPNAPLHSAQKFMVYNLACKARRLIGFNSALS